MSGDTVNAVASVAESRTIACIRERLHAGTSAKPWISAVSLLVSRYVAGKSTAAQQLRISPGLGRFQCIRHSYTGTLDKRSSSVEHTVTVDAVIKRATGYGHGRRRGHEMGAKAPLPSGDATG